MEETWAELFLANDGALSGAPFGDILLIDAASNTRATVFSNVTEGQPSGSYILTYTLGGIPGQIGLSASPGVPDADGDGISEAYELANSDPPSTTSFNPALDDDGDGYTNLQEPSSAPPRRRPPR